MSETVEQQAGADPLLEASNRRAAPRIKKNTPCLVSSEDQRKRRMRIEDVSKTGLLLVWEEGMDRGLSKGQELTVQTEFDGRRLQFEGVIVRVEFAAGSQLIALDGLKWYTI